jgi:hypothetical protein
MTAKEKVLAVYPRAKIHTSTSLTGYKYFYTEANESGVNTCCRDSEEYLWEGVWNILSDRMLRKLET